jgi:colanic acid biosynthesis glycosyl transferase WcaI
MRILHLTPYFDPEPFILGMPLARGLRDLGHEVDVLTGFPNWPGGKVYDGYRIRCRQVEEVEGIRVLRVAHYPSHDRSSLRRIANYASFGLSASTIGLVSARRCDVIHAIHPCGFMGSPAWAFRLLRGVPFVYNIQDLWPQSLLGTGMVRAGWVLGLVAQWLRMTYRLAAHITVISDGMKRSLVSSGVPEDKISVIHNWCDESSIDVEPRPLAADEASLLAGRFNVVYAGNFGLPQALGTVLDAAPLVYAAEPRVQFILVGGGVESEDLVARAEREGLPNVRFLARRPMSEVAAVLQAADVLLVHLRNQPEFAETVPGKIQTYLAAGKPLLAGLTGDAAALVGRSEGGVLFEPESPEALAQAVVQLSRLDAHELVAMGGRGRDFYRRELSLASGVARYEQVLAEAAKRGRRR